MIHLIIRAIPPSNNEYMGKCRSPHVYQEKKREWHWLIKAAIKAKPEKPFEKAVVKITYFFEDAKRHDPDNYSGKFILDALVKEKILIDDNFSVVTLVLDAGIDRDNPRTEVVVSGVSEGGEKLI